MTDAYKPIVIPLRGGLDQSTPAVVGGYHGFNSAFDVDFSYKDEVRGRPAYVGHDGFLSATRGLVNQISGLGSSVNWGSLPATSKGRTSMVRLRGPQGERPGLATQGILFSYATDQGHWVDCQGSACTQVDRVAEFYGGQSQFSFGGAYLHQAAAGSVLGSDGISTGGVQILGSDFTHATRFTPTSGTPLSPGNAARLSSGVELVLTYQAGSLIAYIATAGGTAATSVVLAGVPAAAAPTMGGDLPAICADYDSANFYVAYPTTTAHTVAILKVDPTGTVLNQTTFTFGAGTIQGVWVTNTPNSVGNILVACVDSATAGVFTTVRGMSNVALTAGIDVTVGASQGTGQVVVGAAGAAFAWLAYKDTTNGAIQIFQRSMTAASSSLITKILGTAPTGQFAPVGPVQGRNLWLAHQPVDMNGRVYLGLFVASWFYGTQTHQSVSTASWFALDITDMTKNTLGSNRGYGPVIAAQGPREQTMWLGNPVSAVMTVRGTPGATYVFPTTEWQSVGSIGIAVGSVTLGPFVGQQGTGSLGLNRVTLADPSYAQAGGGTVLSGSVPHFSAGGLACEVGFPVSLPTVKVTAAGAGGFAAGTYSAVAVWRYTDDAGNTHQSASSVAQTWTAGVNTAWNFSCDMPLTERQQSAIDNVFVDIYVNDGAGGTLHFLQASVSLQNSAGFFGGGNVASVTINGPVVTTAPILYSDGGALQNNALRADGGVVTVGNRTWVSDGRALYASQLPVFGQATAWNDGGPLTVDLPATAGRVLALSGVDDKVVALCERGVYVTTGDGPNNLGVGSDFSPAMRVSDLGVAGPRAAVSVPGVGVYFSASPHRPFDSGDAAGAYSGLYLLDRALVVKRVSWPIQASAETQPLELVWSDERQALFVNLGGGQIAVYDARADLWNIWRHPDGSPTIATVGGLLWAGPGTTSPGSYSAPPGNDTVGGGLVACTMQVTTNNLPVNGADGLGWGRVRSIRTIGELPPGSPGNSFVQTYTAVLDQLTSFNKPFTVVTSGTTTWPTGRAAPEWRLPQQKASSIQVTVAASPPVAAWTALELRVLPLGRAPANQRG